MLPVLLSMILIALGIIHFNWATGGTFGFSESLPTKENGERVLNPSKIDSFIVGIGLTLFGFFYLLQSGFIEHNHLPEWVMRFGGWVIPIIFLLRAIGEFKYVGIFKRVKKTKFGRFDTKLFSPLCLIISMLGIILSLIHI